MSEKRAWWWVLAACLGLGCFLVPTEPQSSQDPTKPPGNKPRFDMRVRAPGAPQSWSMIDHKGNVIYSSKEPW